MLIVIILVLLSIGVGVFVIYKNKQNKRLRNKEPIAFNNPIYQQQQDIINNNNINTNNNQNLTPGFNEFEEKPELYQNTFISNDELNNRQNEYNSNDQYIECIPEEEENISISNENDV